MWKVNIEDKVLKFLKKLNSKDISMRFYNLVDSKLKNDPYPRLKKHIIDVNSNGDYLCEFGVDKYRFYYTIINEAIFISNVEFKGSINILDSFGNHKSGDSKNYSNQRRDIKRLKKKFNTDKS